MALKLPKMKKSISGFLSGEEGEISKKAIVAIGVALAGVTSATAASHTSSTNINYAQPNVQAFHSSSVSTTGTTGGPNLSGCCFPAGTKVLMGDGGQKNIENVVIGDMVMSYDENAHSMAVQEVLELKRPIRDHICTLAFDDNTKLRLTEDHGVYTIGGWKAINPRKTDEEMASSGNGLQHLAGRQAYSLLPITKVLQLQIGDMVMTNKLTFKKVARIDFSYGDIQTFNLMKINRTHTFFADEVLVHNAICIPSTTSKIPSTTIIKSTTAPPTTSKGTTVF
jgi:hypothetical protein